MSQLSLQHLEDSLGTFRLTVPQLIVAGTTAVIGPNGAGKTTLLREILGARRPARGRICIEDRVLFDSAARIDVPIEARRLGYVPQRTTLFRHLDVRANVAFGVRGADSLAIADRVLADLALAALGPRRPVELSGGEAQKVALARALAMTPAALLLDEPFASVDVSARDGLRSWLREALQRARIPALLVTHDVTDVRALAEQVLVLEAGAVVHAGSLETAPATPFLSRFSVR